VSDPGRCGCEVSVERGRLVVEPGGCGGALASVPGCRATAVHTLAGRDASAVVVRGEGRLGPRGVALLVAAGRFRSLLDGREPRLAALAGRDPLVAARKASSRGGWLSALAAESGLALAAEGVAGYGVLEPER